jgi:hypothetical protein
VTRADGVTRLEVRTEGRRPGAIKVVA